jgi:hypothetical protein
MQVKTTELKLVQPFAAYRELKDDLERVHVYSSDNMAGKCADCFALLIACCVLPVLCDWSGCHLRTCTAECFLSVLKTPVPRDIMGTR